MLGGGIGGWLLISSVFLVLFIRVVYFLLFRVVLILYVIMWLFVD